MGLRKRWNTQVEYYRLKKILQSLKVKQQHSWNLFFEHFQIQILLKCLWLPVKPKKLLSAWVFDLKIWSKHRTSMLLVSADTLGSRQALEHIWNARPKVSNSTPTKLQTRITFDLIKIFTWFFIPEKAQILNFLKNNIMVSGKTTKATNTTLHQNERFWCSN